MDGTVPLPEDADAPQQGPVRTFTPIPTKAPDFCPAAQRILLVHKDPIERQALCMQCLRAEPRAIVTELSSGQDAITHVLEQRFDLVICDLDLEGIDGLTLLRIIRGRYSRLELPVMFSASASSKETRIRAFQLGASDFLNEEVCEDEFIARMQTQLNVGQMHQNSLILMEELRVLVDTDPLTDLKNRRAFLRDLRAEFSRASRMNQTCALLLLDVDHFKRVNDSFGHPAGDDVLRAIAGLLRDGAREYDAVGRLGGEEFGVLLPEVDVDGAALVAERIRSLVAERPLGPPGVGHVTISIGVAIGPMNRVDNEDALLRRADEALYAAKRNGRNRVYVDNTGVLLSSSAETLCDG